MFSTNSFLVSKNNTLIVVGAILGAIVISMWLRDWGESPHSAIFQAEKKTISKIDGNISNTIKIPEGQRFIIKTEPVDGIVTNQDVVSIKGRVSNVNATITLNNHPIKINKKGYFLESIYLNPGENFHTFVFEDVSKGVRKEKVLSWVLDKTQPFFQIDNLRPDHSLVIADNLVQISGQFIMPGEKDTMVIEEGVNVLAGKEKLVISTDRRSFSGQLSLSDGEHDLLISAVDAAGNKHEQTVKVYIGVLPLKIALPPKLVKNSEGTAMLLFEGKTVPGAMVLFGNRPMETREDGSLRIEIYPHSLKAMYDLGHTKVTAQDNSGRTSEMDIPQKGDYLPPYWKSLTIVKRSNEKASLTGKTSKPNVKVKIGSIESVSDHEGIVRFNNVSIEKDQVLISTILSDSFGNASHIEQWLQPSLAITK